MFYVDLDPQRRFPCHKVLVLIMLLTFCSYVQLKSKYIPGDQRFEEHIQNGPVSDSSASERQDFEAAVEEGNVRNENTVETVERTILQS